MPVGLIIALVLAVGAGVSAAANSSVPGDALYAVKVNINEEVRAAFALSAAAKAQVEADRASERLQEAEELSVEEAVDAETRADIEANFKAFSDRTQARIDALIDTDTKAAADLASNFELALETHDKVLARLATRPDGDEVSALQAKTDGELEETVELRLKAEEKVEEEDGGPVTMEAARGKLGAAANVLVEVDRFITLKEGQLGADAVAAAKAELKKAQDLKAEADATFDDGDYAKAFVMGNAVIRTAQGAKLLIEMQLALDVNLHLGGKPSPTPVPSPRPTPPRTDGAEESELHADGDGASGSAKVHIEFGF